jgi:glycerol kinase
LTTTLAWATPGDTAYAIEGAIYTTGAVVGWLVDGLGILSNVAESAALAQSVDGNAGLYFVPALAGLAAPHWDPRARGAIIGLTSAHTRAHIVRAALEGIAFRVCDVLRTIEHELAIRGSTLRVDGGPSRNDFLMQFLADMLDRPIEVAETSETTARGAALLAGLSLGWWNRDEIARSWRAARRFEPAMAPARREALYEEWERAVERAKDWHRDLSPR